MIGEGQIDITAEIAVLREIGYEGTVSLELFNEELWAKDPSEVLKVELTECRSYFNKFIPEAEIAVEWSSCVELLEVEQHEHCAGSKKAAPEAVFL